MNELIRFEHTFEGQHFTTVTVQDRPAWIAREIGCALGYAREGKRFASQITGEWCADFLDGKDYQVLTGSELQAFNMMYTKGTGRGPFASRRGLLLLYESGLHMALLKTNKPEGGRLRRFLVEQVLPQLVRDGRYLPERAVVEGVLRDPGQERELRLQRRLELEDRKFQAGVLKRTINTLRQLGTIDETLYAAYEVSIAEIALGRELSALKPTTADNWESPSQIASRNDVSAQMVGRVISALELRGNQEGLSRAIINKAKGHDRTVTTYLYSPAAVARIEAELERRRG